MATSVAVTANESSCTTTPLPTLEPYEVLVRVGYTGICGSDVSSSTLTAPSILPRVLGMSSREGCSHWHGHEAPIGTVAVAPLAPCHTARALPWPSGTVSELLFHRFTAPGGDGRLRCRLNLNLCAYPRPALSNCGPHGNADRRPLRPDQAPFPKNVALAAILGGESLASWPCKQPSTAVPRLSRSWTLPRGTFEVATRLGAHHVINSLTDDVAARFAENWPSGTCPRNCCAAPTRQQVSEVVAPGAAHRLHRYPNDRTWSLIRRPPSLSCAVNWTIHGSSGCLYSAPFPAGNGARRLVFSRSILSNPEELITHEFSLDDVAAGLEAMKAGEIASK